jgi:hypothetical protein
MDTTKVLKVNYQDESKISTIIDNLLIGKVYSNPELQLHYSNTKNEILCYGETIVKKVGCNIYILNNTNIDISDILKFLLKTNDIWREEDGNYKINGIYWDGKKANINLF